MYKLIFFLNLFVISFDAYAGNDQPDFNIASLPDSLKTNAYAIVRYSHQEFKYISDVEAVETEKYAITITDKKGSEFANFVCPCDRFRDLKKFSAKLYSAQGILLKKFKLADVKYTEYSTSLATDAKTYYFDCDLPSYPVTIEYELEVNWKKGILSFPTFFPQSGYNISVVSADYQLILPENVEYRKKEINGNFKPEKVTSQGVSTYKWSVGNLSAIESERFDPDFVDFVPALFLSPVNFKYDGVEGKITDWKSLGSWVSGLLNNRGVLTDDTKSKIIEMTKDAKSDREKVKILYDYLGNTTRYVSIQLGIGGLQPIPANEVCRTGFGDCKGLSNYLKSMLSVIGIPSYFTVIKLDASDKTIFEDYSSFSQMNHAILQVPLPNDTLWLECTNPRVPFGFVHNGIAGHDALVDYKGIGKIFRLPDYPDSLNVEFNKANVTFRADGSADVKMSKSCKVKIYDNLDWFPLASTSDQVDFLRKDIILPSAKIENVHFTELKSQLPSLNIDYSWQTSNYGTQTGNRLFIPVNPFRNVFESFKKNKRKHNICVQAGYNDIDSIYLTLPKEYVVESMPAGKVINTEFGVFKSSIERVGDNILVQHSLLFHSGEYNVSAFTGFVDFFEKINTEYQSKIVLKKKI